MADEVKQFHQGWLYAREDGLQFAPYTVTEGVYNQDGTLLSVDMSNLKSTVSEHTNKIQKNTGDITALQQKIQYLDVNESSALYVVDGDGNIIAQIDSTGVRSVDFIIPNTISVANLASTIGGLQDENAFYIVDASGNIAFQVNKDGVTGYNFKTSSGDLNSTIDRVAQHQPLIETYGQNISALQARTQYLNATENDTFYIVDDKGSADGKQGNIIAKVDKDGVHSVNFLSYDENGNVSVNLESFKTETNSSINQHSNKITDLTNAIGSIGLGAESVPNYILGTLENALSNVNLEDSDALYIVDNKGAEEDTGNVIVKVDANGVHSVNFLIADENGEIQTDLLEAVENISKNRIDITALQLDVNGDNSTDGLKQKVASLENKTQKISFDETNNSTVISDTLDVNTLRLDKENIVFTDLEGNIITEINNVGTKSFNFITNEGNLNDVIKSVKTHAEKISNNENAINTITSTTIPTLKTEITEAYVAADNKVTEAYKKADEGLKKELMEGYQAADSNLGNRLTEVEKDIQHINSEKDSVLTSISNNVEISGYLDVDTLKLNKNTFNFTDTSGNLVAKIDAAGVESVDFIAKNGKKFSEIATTVAQHESTIGSHSNLITNNTNAINLINSTTLPNLEDKITKAYTEADNALGVKIKAEYEAADIALENRLDTRLDALETKTKNISLTNDTTTAITGKLTVSNGADISGKLTAKNNIDIAGNANIAGTLDVNNITLNKEKYDFADKDGNVIATIGGAGVESTNFTTASGNFNNIAEKTGNHENAINLINDTTIPNTKTEITKAYQKADTKLSQTLTSAYEAADTAVENRLNTSIEVLKDKTYFISADKNNKTTTISETLNVETLNINKDSFNFIDTNKNTIATINKDDGIWSARVRLGSSKMDCVAYVKKGSIAIDIDL